mgnify:CR=1 FL=1
MKVSLTGNDGKYVMEAVNQGIDSRLQGVTRSKLEWVARGTGNVKVAALEGDIHPDDLKVICRRLQERSEKTEDKQVKDDLESLAQDLWWLNTEKTRQTRRTHC